MFKAGLACALVFALFVDSRNRVLSDPANFVPKYLMSDTPPGERFGAKQRAPSYRSARAADVKNCKPMNLLDEFQERISVLKNVTYDEATGRLVGILQWLEEEPVTLVDSCGIGTVGERH